MSSTVRPASASASITAMQQSVDTLMKQADMAMYQAKDSGRNAVRFFDPVDAARGRDARSQLEADLRGALPNQQLHLYYQIQVDADHRPIGRGGADPLDTSRARHGVASAVHPGRGGEFADPRYRTLGDRDGMPPTCRCGRKTNRCAICGWRSTSAHSSSGCTTSSRRLQGSLARHSIVPERLKLELTESVVLEDIADRGDQDACA